MRFGDNLRNLRISRNLTQQQLADDLHISQSAIGSYEKNIREPSFTMIQRLADYFGVPFSYMVPSPSERPTDDDRVLIIATTIQSNVKLRMLFDKATMMEESDLDALLGVAMALSKGDT